MRILFVVGAYPPSDKHGGPPITNHCLAKALKKLGHEVFVLTTDINGKERLDVVSGNTEWDNIGVRYCRWIKSPIPIHSPELGRELRKIGSNFDIALISSAWNSYGLSASKSCRKTDLPYIMYPHGSFDRTRLRRSCFKKKVFWKLFDKHIYNRANGVVALTESEANQLQAMEVKSPITVIPNGVLSKNISTSQSKSELQKNFCDLIDHSFILFLGRLEQIKGIDILVKAFAQIHNDFPSHTLVLAGPNERGHRQEIEELIKQYNLFDSVLFTGHVDGSVKQSLLHCAEAFVLSSYGEGLPMSVLEAMATGIPVVISDKCHIPEVQTSNAGVIVSCDPHSVANGLRKVLADPSAREIMGENGKHLINEKFTWEKVAAATETLCKQIIKSKSNVRENQQI